MIALIVTSVAIVLVILGILAGIVAAPIVMRPAERKRLEVMTEKMICEIRQDAMTRATIAEMRSVVRDHLKTDRL